MAGARLRAGIEKEDGGPPEEVGPRMLPGLNSIPPPPRGCVDEEMPENGAVPSEALLR